MVIVLKSTVVDKNEYHVRTKQTAEELYIRRLTVEEALLKLEEYLNDAYMAGLYRVTVVHGKGTGTLRQVVQNHLSRHPLVKSYHPGDYREGGSGVTIVELSDH